MANQNILSVVDPNDQTRLVTWATLGNADTGQGFAIGAYANANLVVQGTFGGATLVLQGSNDGGTTWINLKDQFNAAISVATNNSIVNLGNLPLLVRPSTSGGAGTALTVLLSFSKTYF